MKTNNILKGILLVSAGFVAGKHFACWAFGYRFKNPTEDDIVMEDDKSRTVTVYNRHTFFTMGEFKEGAFEEE